MPAGVAQIGNLPYRRIESCRAFAESNVLEFADALPMANRRYGRLQVCATANALLVLNQRCAQMPVLTLNEIGELPLL